MLIGLVIILSFLLGMIVGMLFPEPAARETKEKLSKICRTLNIPADAKVLVSNSKMTLRGSNE